MRLLISIFVFFGVAFSAMAEDGRVALVVGNSKYESVAPLKNPVQDASDIGAALTRLGFDVTTALDVSFAEMGRAVVSFARKAATADMAVIYYAGHGVEVNRRNFLLPVDADIRQTLDLEFQALNLDTLLRSVEGAKTLRLVLLDACRDNPFSSQFAESSRSVGRGLSEIEPPGGIIVSYAARGGTVAFDGEGDNSPYAAAILEHLETPGLEIGKLFRSVRDSVLNVTAGRQEPFTYGSLSSDDIFLAGRAAPRSAVADFARAQAAGTVEAWDAFVADHEADDAQRPLVLAARRLRQDLLPPVQATPSQDPIVLDIPAVTPEAIEETLRLSKQQLLQIQTLLNALGYELGTPDGAFGKRSRAALKEFQSDETFEATGFLDARSLAKLKQRYDESPTNLDGDWELALSRTGATNGRDFKTRADTMAIAKLNISGRLVEIVSIADMTSVPNPRPVALRANLTKSGRLELSYVLNADFFKRTNARRVAAAVNLPERVRYGQVFEARGGRLNGKYGSGVTLRRLDPNREKQAWE